MMTAIDATSVSAHLYVMRSNICVVKSGKTVARRLPVIYIQSDSVLDAKM